eukprot:1782501-Heterocapsa_arctica.AAC.1
MEVGASGHTMIDIADYDENMDPANFGESDREAWEWARGEVLGTQQGSIDEVLGPVNPDPT